MIEQGIEIRNEFPLKNRTSNDGDIFIGETRGEFESNNPIVGCEKSSEKIYSHEQLVSLISEQVEERLRSEKNSTPKVDVVPVSSIHSAACHYFTLDCSYKLKYGLIVLSLTVALIQSIVSISLAWSTRNPSCENNRDCPPGTWCFVGGQSTRTDTCVDCVVLKDFSGISAFDLCDGDDDLMNELWNEANPSNSHGVELREDFCSVCISEINGRESLYSVAHAKSAQLRKMSAYDFVTYIMASTIVAIACFGEVRGMIECNLILGHIIERGNKMTEGASSVISFRCFVTCLEALRLFVFLPNLICSVALLVQNQSGSLQVFIFEFHFFCFS